MDGLDVELDFEGGADGGDAGLEDLVVVHGEVFAVEFGGGAEGGAGAAPQGSGPVPR